jgi:hypothetical protein
MYSLPAKKKEMRSENSLFKLHQGNLLLYSLAETYTDRYDSLKQSALQVCQLRQESADVRTKIFWRGLRGVKNFSSIVRV